MTIITTIMITFIIIIIIIVVVIIAILYLLSGPNLSYTDRVVLSCRVFLSCVVFGGACTVTTLWTLLCYS